VIRTKRIAALSIIGLFAGLTIVLIHDGWTAHADSSCTTYPLYQFLIRPASQNTWQVVQTYSTTATYDWNSTGAAVGTVYIGVWVKDSASPNSYDAVNSTPVSVT
jgi:hypothetical protein